MASAPQASPSRDTSNPRRGRQTAAARAEAEAVKSGYNLYYGVPGIHYPRGQRPQNPLGISAQASEEQTAAVARADSLGDDATAERIRTEFDPLNDDFSKLDEITRPLVRPNVVPAPRRPPHPGDAPALDPTDGVHIGLPGIDFPRDRPPSLPKNEWLANFAAREAAGAKLDARFDPDAAQWITTEFDPYNDRITENGIVKGMQPQSLGDAYDRAQAAWKDLKTPIALDPDSKVDALLTHASHHAGTDRQTTGENAEDAQDRSVWARAWGLVTDIAEGHEIARAANAAAELGYRLFLGETLSEEELRELDELLAIMERDADSFMTYVGEAIPDFERAIDKIIADYNNGDLSEIPMALVARTYEEAVGGAYLFLRDLTDADGNPLDPDSIRAGAMLAGTLSTGLDLFPPALLIRRLPGMKTIGRYAPSEIVRRVLQRQGVSEELADILRDSGGELTNDFINRSLTILTREAARIVIEQRDMEPNSPDLGSSVPAIDALPPPQWNDLEGYEPPPENSQTISLRDDPIGQDLMTRLATVDSLEERRAVADEVVLTYGIRDNAEYMVILDENGDVLDIVRGTENRVRFAPSVSRHLLERSGNAYVTHYHPRPGAALSTTDLANALQTGATMTAVTSAGEVYTVTITDQARQFGQDRLGSAMRSVTVTIDATLRKLRDRLYLDRDLARDIRPILIARVLVDLGYIEVSGDYDVESAIAALPPDVQQLIEREYPNAQASGRLE